MNAEQSCHRKKRYWTEAYAQGIAAKCLRKRGVQLRVYLCEFCFGYHLTHKAKHERAA